MSKNKYLEIIKKELDKEFGDGTLVDGTDFTNKDVMKIPISPMLDSICGGIQSGSFVTFYGPPGVGKTLTAMQFGRNAQDEKYKLPHEDDCRHIYYHNLEHRIKKRDIYGIEGLDTSRLHIIESTKNKILSAENHLHIADKEIRTHPGSIIIFDSVAAMCTDTELSKDIGDSQAQAAPQRLLARFCRKMSSAVYVHDCIVISITQLMGNPSGYGGNKEKGGLSLAYQADTKLYAKNSTFWKATDKGDPIGQVVEWQTIKSSYKSPGRIAESWIKYGTGIDIYLETIKLASQLGLIEQGGAWFTYKDHKVQGAAKLAELLKSDVKVYNELTTDLYKLI